MRKNVFVKIIVAAILLMLVATLTVGAFAEDNEVSGGLLISPNPMASAVTVGNLTVNKTQFAVGEPIYVTAYGEGEDWVAIYKKNGSDSAIRYYYIEEQNASGVAVNMLDCASKNNLDLTHGNYMLYYYEDGNFAPKHKIEIVIGDGDPVTAPKPPVEVAYFHDNVKPYLADGSVVIVLPTDGDAAREIYGYWSKGGSMISGYSELFRCAVPDGTTKMTVEIAPNTLIPEGADGIMVYTANSKGKLFSRNCLFPETVKTLPVSQLGEEVISLQIVADTHSNETNNSLTGIKKMFTDITRNDPDSIGVFVVGDIADNGVVEQYEEFIKAQNSVKNAPPSYWVVGNHDYWKGRNHASGLRDLTYQQMVDQFNNTNGNDSEKPYYDLWIEGYHFIFLGYEENGISLEQEAWLAEKIAENAREDKPIFIFLHQPIAGTVAGSFEYEGYTTFHPRDSFLEIIASYPQAMLFSGHGHAALTDEYNMLTPTEDHCYLFNSGAIIGAETGFKKDNGKPLKISEGWYVTVYENYVVLRGRDFTNDRWMPSAQFIVHFDGSDLHYASEEVKAAVRAEIEAKAPQEQEQVTTTTVNPNAVDAPTDPATPIDTDSKLSIPVIIAVSAVAVAAVSAVVAVAIKKKKSK